jgi:hypothetical protein
MSMNTAVPRDAPKLETLDALSLIAEKTHQKRGGNRFHATVGVKATPPDATCNGKTRLPYLSAAHQPV